MIRVGIFFGGSAREREVSFAGGRTVYDNLSRKLFTPIPIFVDSEGQFIQLDWKHIYKGAIRDFYPPASSASRGDFQVYAESLQEEKKLRTLAKHIGILLPIEELSRHIDVAFLVLHGPKGEDGSLQGLLEWLNIPYTGAGIYASALGMDKAQQRKLMAEAKFSLPHYRVIQREEWLEQDKQKDILRQLSSRFSRRCVVKPANEGSSIGVSVVDPKQKESLRSAIDKAFFIHRLSPASWHAQSAEEKKAQIQALSDLRGGVGMPLYLEKEKGKEKKYILHPEELYQALEQSSPKSTQGVLLAGSYREHSVLVESFIEGIEFSCIVIEDLQGQALPLPPTEIVKAKEVYDYRAKYLPGISHKYTPMRVEAQVLRSITDVCKKLYRLFGFEVYARMDGFYGKDHKVYLNDPNTSSGMLPSSFFFHQAAEIGLDPSSFLSYIIHRALAVRHEKSKKVSYTRLYATLDKVISKAQSIQKNTLRVGILTGGYSAERHIALESGRNIYEKLSSSIHFSPIPIFLSRKKDDTHTQDRLHRIPIHMLLKDHVDDIVENLEEHTPTPFLHALREEALPIRKKYGSPATNTVEELSYERLAKEVDLVFIALHGRPGEDGSIQACLEAVGLPYTGSGIESSRITINKQQTAQKLAAAGFSVPLQYCIEKEHFMASPQTCFDKAERQCLAYPCIAKPLDDGCSTAVCKINNRKELEAYARAIFRESKTEPLNISFLAGKEDFPSASCFLVEAYIDQEEATHFLEITIGLLTHWEKQKIRYEVFEPSEVLVKENILSLEEKFLAGEGQNITPARLSKNPIQQKKFVSLIKDQVKRIAQTLSLEGYARIDAFVKIHDDKVLELIVLEVNSLPGMTPATCLFHQSAYQGYTPHAFISAIIRYAQKKHAAQRVKK